VEAIGERYRGRAAATQTIGEERSVTDKNLDLDTGRGSKVGASDTLARVCVVLACGYVRDSGATTLTPDCRSYEEFEREVERLKGELDSILERSRAHFSEAPAASAEASDSGPAAAEAGAPRALPRVGGDLRVRDLMTADVKTLRRNDQLSAADELMKVGRFRHVVVLDDDDSVAGVLSQRSIFYGALAWSLGHGTLAHQKALEAFAVKDVMETDVVTVHPDSALGEAAATMMERKIGCLPVVDAGRLVGILTEGDFLAMLTGSS
jgi:CBS domain-containing protein